MTRGAFYLITTKKIYQSIEFNGDMYGGPNDSIERQEMGRYNAAIRTLDRCKDKKTFVAEITKFNRVQKFNYSQKMVWNFEEYHNDSDGRIVLDFNDDYAGRFFSDYLYFKNVRKKPVIFILTTLDNSDNHPVFHLLPNKIATFVFGRFIEII